MGFDLGLERAGHECVGQIEIEPYATKVLEKHWPQIWRHDDIKTLGPKSIPAADLWVGGFPCQDISCAGGRAGIRGTRSGLFFTWMRLVRMVRPQYILMENVAALLHRGMAEVLGELSKSGYDAEWDCLSAGAFGANHLRSRIFLVAYPKGNAIKSALFSQEPPSGILSGKSGGGGVINVPGSYWSKGEPRLSEMADGVPYWTRQVSCYGNAVVPAVAEYIGNLLMEWVKS